MKSRVKNSRSWWPRRLKRLLLIVGIVIAVGYVSYCSLRPVNVSLAVNRSPLSHSLAKAVSLPWPSIGSSSFGAVGYGVLASHSGSVPESTASIAKVITALSILQVKPIASGETGPTITLTAADVAIYDKYTHENGSTIPVTAGEQLTEYQALEAMMIPSANNIADTLAIWAFGSLSAYHAYANTFVKTMGMTQTTTASDASGFSPQTTSTTDDLVHMGEAALANPTLAQIVGERTVTIAGITYDNYDSLLGKSQIVGIKTGNNTQDGGAFLGAAHVSVGDQTLTIITAVMGANTLQGALLTTLPLIQAAPDNFSLKTPLKSGDVVGTVTTPWGSSSTVTASQDLTLITWDAVTPQPTLLTQKVSSSDAAQTIVGTATVADHAMSVATNLVLSNRLDAPSFWWRLTHPR